MRRAGFTGRAAGAVLCVCLMAVCGAETRNGLEARVAALSPRPDWWGEVTIPIPVTKSVALPEDPEWEDSLTAYGMQFEAEGKGREAIKVLTYALPECTTPLQRAFVLFQSALTYEIALKDFVRAYALFGELTRLELADADRLRETRAYARFGKARCLEKAGAMADARAGYEEVLRDFPPLDVELLFQLGGLARAQGEAAAAERHYNACIRAAEPKGSDDSDIYYGRFILMSKIALREMASGPVDLARLGNGVYVGKAYGYNSMITVSTTVQDGRIVEIELVDVDDKRPFDAASVIPQRIKDGQRLDVDAVTGATVTSDAIINAMKQGLRGEAQKLPARNRRSAARQRPRR